MTTTELLARVSTYNEAGSVNVHLQWEGGCGVAGPAFTGSIPKGSSMELWTIPSGTKDVRVWMQSDDDVDIRLFDLDNTTVFPEGRAIIGWCKPRLSCNYGPATSTYESSSVYAGQEIWYSGYTGEVDSDSGKRKLGYEWCLLSGSTSRTIGVSVYSYQAGSVDAIYTYNSDDDFA